MQVWGYNKLMRRALAILRNRKTKTDDFRAASRALSTALARKTAALLKKRRVALERAVIVIILRSGAALFEPALRVFPGAAVGVLGIKRDERTFAPRWYYENLPPFSKRSVVVMLDPMLATGGSAEAAAKRLIARGAAARNIYFIGIVAAPEGLRRLARHIPQENIILASIDEGLDTLNMIVPGLGDFGDRYFGTSGTLALL